MYEIIFIYHFNKTFYNGASQLQFRVIVFCLFFAVIQLFVHFFRHILKRGIENVVEGTVCVGQFPAVDFAQGWDGETFQECGQVHLSRFLYRVV